MFIHEAFKAPEKTTDMSEVTDKLYHTLFYQTQLVWTEFELTTLVMIDIDCIGSYKSNKLYDHDEKMVLIKCLSCT